MKPSHLPLCSLRIVPSYWDVEARMVPVSVESDFIMDPKNAIQYIDENTIGVVVILGSTYTGHFEDVQGMNDLREFSVVLWMVNIIFANFVGLSVTELQSRTGLDIPIHVDAASGGFFAPFAYPGYKWAFDVPRVASINVSGHKFGLVSAVNNLTSTSNLCALVVYRYTQA